MTQGISRRGFITAAATAAAGAALAGMAGCGSPKSATEKKAGEAAAGTRWSWETKPEAVPDSKISQMKDCDVCVVGLGSAGTTATLAAAQSGAKVITLQKMPSIQTNGWCVAAYNSKMFLEAGQTYDLAQIYANFADLSNGRDNPKVVKLFLKRSGEVVDYLIRQTPDFTPVMQKSGHTYGWYINNDMATRYEQFRLLLTAMVDKAVAAGAEILYETPAQQLVQDSNGWITGVIAKQKDGSYIKVNASKGVIMATGDISDDDEMLECYAPQLLDVQSMHGAPCNTGDGHKMGMWAGAAMDKAPHCIMMHFDPTWMPEGNSPYSGIPWLRVNLKGDRFANENLGYQSVVTSVHEQPDQTAFQITDANWAVHATAGDYPHPNSHSRATADPAKDWQAALDRGAIVQANTLEELADKIGVEKATFLKTVERYNELSDRGVDEDFGVPGDFISYNAIKVAPFFAIKRMPGRLSTVSGLKVNEKLEVINEKGEPLGGLYAAGNCSGSYYGDDYPLFITGGSHGRAWTFGVLSARSALGKLDESVETLGN
ncbi:FAD-dependent oxidoreductase [Curtanaerobium respiraculi]|uniref:FAD-dependent oxidoreductase n=1 Tax=Curtanaerobium respiraculi TaxID=2949669 RepID=UPI0024B3AD8B|nr:FAD-binding protein [Curtanaerobium respiraculi]